MNLSLLYVLGAGAMAMAFSFWKTNWISNQKEGNDRMKSIGLSISEGAMAFLRAEYRILSIFVVAVAILLGFANSGRADSSILISSCKTKTSYEKLSAADKKKFYSHPITAIHKWSIMN